jgi:predicted glycosyltransferase
MEETKLQETLNYIETRIKNYSIPIFTKIVDIYTESKETKRSEQLLRTALRVANFYDLYYETGDGDFLKWAEEYKNLLYENIDPKTKSDLKNIEKQILPFLIMRKKFGIEFSWVDLFPMKK